MNEKTINHMNAMYEKWLAEQFPSRVHKTEPLAGSITTVKWALRVKRSRAREILARK